jgi:glyoxylase-like metal-dependent hydrolase (beta-lactamase superfamily II)
MTTAQPSIRPVDGKPGIHRLGSWVVSWYLVEDEEGLVAIDAGLPGFKDTLEADLAAIDRRPEDVDAVLLTHSDVDHTGVAARLGAAGARVFIHPADKEAARKPGPKKGDASPIHALTHLWRPSFWRSMGSMLRSGAMKPTKLEQTEDLAAGEKLDVPGRPLVVHTPGHTPGHCAFLFEQHSIAFVGDALCSRDPFTGRTGPGLIASAANESNADALESLAAIEALEADTLLFGHGEPWRQGAAAAVAAAREVARA